MPDSLARSGGGWRTILDQPNDLSRIDGERGLEIRMGIYLALHGLFSGGVGVVCV